MEESDKVLSCAFCRVRLFVTTGEFFRYVFPAPDLAPEETILVPYWRFRGMMFTRDDTGLRDQVLDSTALGTRTMPLPRSLGIRPQALPLRFLPPDWLGGMLSADIPLQEALKNVYKSFPEARIPLEGDRPAGTEHERLVAMIGESVSMIYSPVYISKGNLCDAVLKEPVAPAPAGILDNVLPHGDGEKWKTSFLPALCPDCGWDLNGDRRSLVQVCMKCSGAWSAAGGAYRRIGCGTVLRSDEEATLVPFWSISADLTGIELKNYDDLVRLMNLPRQHGREREDDTLSFWIPAFKLRPGLFLRLARQMTLLQVAEDGREVLEGKRVHAVTLPIEEAIESIRILLASLSHRRGWLSRCLNDVSIKIRAYSLLYLPFTTKGAELVQPALRIGMPLKALDHGLNI